MHAVANNNIVNDNNNYSFRKYHVPVMNLQRFFEFMLPAGSNFSFFKAVSSNIQINVRYNRQTK